MLLAPEPLHAPVGCHLNGAFRMSAADYHRSDGVSKSMLDRLHQSPAHLRHYLDHPEQGDSTPARIFGERAHLAVFEPHLHRDHYHITDLPRRGTVAWADAENVAADYQRELIKRDEYDEIQALTASVHAHPQAAALLQQGHAEVSLFAEDYETGLLLRGRVDWWPPGNALVDLKTTTDASPGAFARHIADHRYHAQAAFYLDLATALGHAEKELFIIIAVEKAPPYAVAVYHLDGATVEAGRRAYRRDLNRFCECQTFNRWPGYSNTLQTISLPAWAMKEAA